ncbi:nitroreductase family deazaflavin-dependent oxidoreductase [Nocardioides acrostichi]|uniref:Nitroreductase family deazaflavin-dependent oxidoreductase n=1 Tax=Nocardioides acrostichi TaxID=2784339 RepID=A0A930V455_9ACTN|nr:nitroreductase family deazaflavin-dependent oxidoreductase [Nocardioides acrostichi]MBF4163487.1 nitroreductase family deazaflavin-dependent oxidoreductase [Nocardioides acrostichi]
MTLTGEYQPSPEAWVRNQVEAFEASDGQEANTLPDHPEWPIVVITSRGAKSGVLRKNPVMRVEKDGAYAAVASKGGAPEHPTWFHNFVAHPEVDLQDGAEKHTYRARIVEGAEREEWWQRAAAVFAPYLEYQEKTDREIPVFVLERV